MSTTDTERDERLRGIQERTEGARDLLPPESIDYSPTDDYLAHLADDADYLLAEITRLDAVVTAVREVHQPEAWEDDLEGTSGVKCATCIDSNAEPAAYPCATVRALDGGAS